MSSRQRSNSLLAAPDSLSAHLVRSRSSHASVVVEQRSNAVGPSSNNQSSVLALTGKVHFQHLAQHPYYVPIALQNMVEGDERRLTHSMLACRPCGCWLPQLSLEWCSWHLQVGSAALTSGTTPEC